MSDLAVWTQFVKRPDWFDDAACAGMDLAVNRRQARAHAYYFVGAWADDVLQHGGALSNVAEFGEWTDADRLKIEHEISAITSRLFDRWYAAGAPKIPVVERS